MKITQIKWTQENCIKCGLVIMAILLALYLFRHYTIIEGFDLGTSSLPSVSLPSLPSFSSTSQFGPIGPVPKDNKWSDQTVTEFKVAYKTVMTTDYAGDITEMFKYATEDDAKYFIKNKKWEWPQYYFDCLKEGIKYGIDERVKAGVPAPTPEEIQTEIDKSLSNIAKNYQVGLPIRAMVSNPVFSRFFDTCLKPLKETQFIDKLEGASKEKITVGENKSLMCKLIGVTTNEPGKTTATYHMGLAIDTLDPATNKTTTEETTFDKITSLVSGFNFLKGGKTTNGDAATCQNFREVPFELDDKGVSPFYQALWGIPASNSTSLSTNSQPATISSSDESTTVLRQIKKQLDSMPTI
jgi:hypothetical protein